MQFYSDDEVGGFQKTRKSEKRNPDELPRKTKDKRKKQDYSKQRDTKRGYLD